MATKPSKRKKKKTDKMPESAKTAYTRCITDIENFQKLAKAYQTLVRSTDPQSMSPENQSTIACMKAALMQTICLIGDTLTWVRPGGRDRYEFSEPALFAAAEQIGDDNIKMIIDLRNVFPHEFLYKGSKDKARDFESLFSVETETALASIKANMKEQLEGLKEDAEKMLTGVSQQGDAVPHQANECWAVAIGELELLEDLLKNKTQLIKAVGEDNYKKSLDWCIKNVCEAHKDFLRLTEVTGQANAPTPEQFEVLSKLHTKLNTAEKDVLLFLEREGDDLRILLAHPNVLESAPTKTAREHIIKHSDLFKRAFINLWKKANEESTNSGIEAPYTERSLSAFYSQVAGMAYGPAAPGDTEIKEGADTTSSKFSSSFFKEAIKKSRTKKQEVPAAPKKSSGWDVDLDDLFSNPISSSSQASEFQAAAEASGSSSSKDLPGGSPDTGSSDPSSQQLGDLLSSAQHDYSGSKASLSSSSSAAFLPSKSADSASLGSTDPSNPKEEDIKQEKDTTQKKASDSTKKRKTRAPGQKGSTEEG